MSPKSMVWVSVITLLISIATLALVWQMQKQLAHSSADALMITDGNPNPSSGPVINR